MTKSPRPRDPNQLARMIADIAVGDYADPMKTEDGRDLAAVLLGRRGGLKGGRARADKLTPEERQRIAREAAVARWKRRAADGGLGRVRHSQANPLNRLGAISPR